MQELRSRGLQLVQAAVAAGVSWAVAHDVVGHQSPFFAPVAATIVLGLAPGRRIRRAIEMVIGIAVGIAVGDLLIAAIGSGAIQIALIVLLAMSTVVLLGGGPLVIAQATTSGVLVATLPASHGVPSRFVDALIGGCIGLAVLAIVPRNPLRTVQRATRPLFGELAAVLEGIAGALSTGDRAAADRTLARARATSELSARFRQELELARETARLAPTQWRSRNEVERYADAAAHLDYAVRNVRVLARASITAIEFGEIPAGLPNAVRELATGVRGLERELGEHRGAAAAMEAVLAAAGHATLVLEESPPLPISVIVGQIRSTAVDLLRGLGLDREEAVEHVRAAARRVRSSDLDGDGATPAGEPTAPDAQRPAG